LTPGSAQSISGFGRKFARRIDFFLSRKQVLGARSVIWIGVSVMQTDHPKHHRRSGPSLWADLPADDALSLLEHALREDQPSRREDQPRDDLDSLRAENARLRKLLTDLLQPLR
jgi:hypothetical protein